MVRVATSDPSAMVAEDKPAPKPAKAPKGLHHPAGQFPWTQIVAIAKKLLAKDPTRSWKIGELASAVRKAGASIVSATGRHFGLLPRLRKLGVINETGEGIFTGKKPTTTSPKAEKKAVKTVVEKAPATVGKPPAARKSEKKTTKRVVKEPEATKPVAKEVPKAVQKKPKATIGEKLIAACQKLLDADPFKVWQARDLVKALRAEGVSVPNWAGMHYKILPLLKSAKLIEFEDGGFRSAVRPTPPSEPGAVKSKNGKA
ncbi:MAG: hypothetical protein HY815_10260 [Candidatus Riflebacteria bacterium]|nr:hypothetical protein [Candidatus Riflebacteria bacterium]